MNPRLIALAGPSKAKPFAVQGEEVSVGRDPSNDIPVNDISVSRRHCLILKDGECFKAKDLESRNGTFINDIPIQERSLEHGDQLKCGNSVFLFLVDEAEPVSSPSNGVQLEEEALLTKSAVSFKIEDAISLMARDLRVLIEISTKITSIRDLEALQRELLELIFEVVPAQRGAILLWDEGAEEFGSVFGLHREPDAHKGVRVSRTIALKVLREGVAVLSNDVLESDRPGLPESLIASRIQSLLCVPLILLKKVLGVVYVDTVDPGARFDEDHLRLVTAIANIAAGVLDKTQQMDRLERENRRLLADIDIEHNMIGESPRMREVYQIIAKVAPSDSTVLLRGESGTGKELAARAIHQNSTRSGKPFVAINCAVLSETLLESELFGHEKGAFTGAVAQKKGKLEIAEGGTVFLDEVGELPLPLQAKLLRVLQEREFERVGGTRTIKVNVRFIAATNKDLEESIRQRAFRQDLYYRLNVVTLLLPALRQRREDIPLLARYFVSKYSGKCKRRITGISTATRGILVAYDWPGNVRELENAIERASVLGATEQIEPEDLPEALLEAQAAPDAPAMKYYELIKEAKKRFIRDALEQSEGDYAGAAKLLGVHPNNLHRLIRNLNLKDDLKK